MCKFKTDLDKSSDLLLFRASCVLQLTITHHKVSHFKKVFEMKCSQVVFGELCSASPLTFFIHCFVRLLIHMCNLSAVSVAVTYKDGLSLENSPRK